MEDPPDDAKYNNFNEQSIACCPLEGLEFESNARKVHQIILSFATGENAEQWIKTIARQQKRRSDIVALRGHYYQGKGN